MCTFISLCETCVVRPIPYLYVVGSILNIFSYDQWGVELGKSIASEILKGKKENLDKSTERIKQVLKR